MQRSPGHSDPLPLAGTWIVDLDGVVWLTGDPIEGAGEAVRLLREVGVRVVFATNNSSPTTDELVGRLARADIPAAPDDLITSADAAASLVGEGDAVLTLAGPGARRALEARRARLVEDGPADAVVVGWTDAFTFDALARASGAVRSGARLIGTNDDPALPTPGGLLPGAGALLAAVATASGATPEVAGKPYAPMIELIRGRHPDLTVVVGDRPSTDGRLATALGVPFGLVLSGVTQAGAPVEPAPQATGADFVALVRAAMAG